MEIKFSPPDITDAEIQRVAEVLKSGWITTGPKTKEFEREIARYAGADRAVCLNSATACMELTLRVLGIGEGDEVVTSAYTYTASASVISHVGAKIVLVDTADGSYQMDYESLERAITEKTKAVIAVDIAGVPCDYIKIAEILGRKSNIFKAENELQAAIGRVAIIADAAHSFGAMLNGQPASVFADFTSYSFHAVKNLTTAEGGALVWRNFEGISSEDLYREFMLWSLHGQNKDALSKTKLGSWEYDIKILGYKCNMTDIMAGIGLAQLNRYADILKRRKEIIGIYDQRLRGINVDILTHFSKEYCSSGHLYLTRIKDIDELKRNEIVEEMAKRGIATNVHYKPLPVHTAYKNLGFNIENYPNSYNQYKNEITLPLHSLLTDEEAEYVADNYADILRRI